MQADNKTITSPEQPMAVEPRAASGQAMLDEVVRRILSAGSPLKIVLFGSHARGEARPDSDLDLLIVEQASDIPSHKRAIPYRMALVNLDNNTDIDIVVSTPEEIADWANVRLAFLTTVMREGKVLFEKRR